MSVEAIEVEGIEQSVLARQAIGTTPAARSATESFSTYNALGIPYVEHVEIRNDSIIPDVVAFTDTSVLTEPESAYPVASAHPVALELPMEQLEMGEMGEGKFDFRRNRFPYSVVFQPLPPLTWLLPLIGHMGVCDSEGRVHDFQGPYTIRVV